MDQHAALIETIAIGLGAAFIGGLVARRLRLPPIVGYIVAGVSVGPFTPGLVADPATAMQLAELGVILLMFGVGIHFSIRDLLAVRSIAIPGAVGQSLVATALGVLLGVALGWGLVGGLVLGLSISVASTVVLLRALMERGELDTQQGRIAVGWLIVEDLFTVGVLVLLPPIAPLLQGESGDLLAPLAGVGLALAKAAVFAALMVVVGGKVVPAVLAVVARERSRELFTLSVLAIAIGIAWSASAVFGVSFALGAFLAGAVLSGSDMSHQAAADALPLRDAFAVLFFVSVGMLLDPGYLVSAPLAILAVTLLIVVAKSAAAFAIVSTLGYSVRTSLTVSAALAQIGEFSFILATLGLALDLIPPEAYQLVVAGAIVSISLNPFVFRLVEPLERWLHDRPRLLSRLERRASHLSVLPVVETDALRSHAVLCGYGRVGKMVATAFERRGFRYVVISDDRREVERLRDAGVLALYGDAANEDLLQAAHVETARVLIVAISDAQSARLAVERTRGLAPRVPVVVRTHSGTAALDFRAMGSGVQPVHAERELAIQIARFSLRRFGVSAVEVDAIATGLRERGGTGGGPPSSGSANRLRSWLASLWARFSRAGRTPIETAEPDAEADPAQLPAERIQARLAE
ncbi:MAG: sodium:proton antiporter [Chloroflexi bacterium]|nr:sodium:proton antiporter [Chloroflexota bacterium]